MNFKIILFANTLWFIEKFKFDLVKTLSKNNKIECIYLREGPPCNMPNIRLLKNNKVKFKRLNLINFISLFFRQFFYAKKQDYRILVFTITSILISQLIFFAQKKNILYVLEGLGRVFSSRNLSYRLLKRFLILLYKIIFYGSKGVVTLNHSDATLLAKFKIAKINKIFTIPGTGLDISQSKIDFIKKFYKPKYIDYVARLIDDKGYYAFVNTKKYINRHLPSLNANHLFRIITPYQDIKNLDKDELIFLKQEGIVLMPYLDEPNQYYKNTSVLIIPTTYGEGLSRVLLESIFFGIPVLVSRNIGTEELLPHDYEYFLLSLNPAIVANQLNDLIKNKEKCIKKIKKQKNIILNNYSSKASIKAFFEIIK